MAASYLPRHLSLPAFIGKRKRPQQSVYEISESAQEGRVAFEQLKLDERDVAKLHAVFMKISKDKDFFTQSQMLNFLELDRSKFLLRFFRNYDVGKTGKVGFKDFVLATWNYCTLSKSSLVIFAFDLYDSRNHGYINEDDIKDFIRDVYGSSYEANKHAMKMYEKLDKMCLEEQDHGLNIDQFTQFTTAHSNMLYPAFSVQNRLRERVVSPRFWRRAARHRLGRDAAGRHITAEGLLAAQVHLPTFDALAGDAATKENHGVLGMMLFSGLKEKRYREWKAAFLRRRALRDAEREAEEGEAARPPGQWIGNSRVDEVRNYNERDKYKEYFQKTLQDRPAPDPGLTNLISAKKAAAKLKGRKHLVIIPGQKERQKQLEEREAAAAAERERVKAERIAEAHRRYGAPDHSTLDRLLGKAPPPPGPAPGQAAAAAATAAPSSSVGIRVQRLEPVGQAGSKSTSPKQHRRQPQDVSPAWSNNSTPKSHQQQRRGQQSTPRTGGTSSRVGTGPLRSNACPAQTKREIQHSNNNTNAHPISLKSNNSWGGKAALQKKKMTNTTTTFNNKKRSMELESFQSEGI